MSVPISGILLDPYGNVARFADIKFVTVQGTLDVIESSSAVFRTDENGAYSIDVQFGRFAVLMRFNGNNGAYDKIQTISVNSDTVASTLGELLAYTEPLTPAEILLVQQLVAQAIAAKDDAEAAALQAAIEAANAAASAAAAANSVALLAPVPLNGGVWASGQTFTAYNQYMIYNGEAYSPRQETTLPYTVGASPDLGFVYQIKLNSLQALSGLTEPSDLDQVHARVFANVDAMLAFNGFQEGQQVVWQGYYSQSDGGGNCGVVEFGPHTSDGGSIFSIDANTYISANISSKVDAKKFGFFPTETYIAPTQVNKAIDYMNLNGGGDVTLSAGWYRISDSIVVKDNVSLIGCGMGVTYIDTGTNSIIAITTESKEEIPLTQTSDFLRSDVTNAIATTAVKGDFIRYKNANRFTDRWSSVEVRPSYLEAELMKVEDNSIGVVTFTGPVLLDFPLAATGKDVVTFTPNKNISVKGLTIRLDPSIISSVPIGLKIYQCDGVILDEIETLNYSNAGISIAKSLNVATGVTKHVGGDSSIGLNYGTGYIDGSKYCSHNTAYGKGLRHVITSGGTGWGIPMFVTIGVVMASDSYSHAADCHGNSAFFSFGKVIADTGTSLSGWGHSCTYAIGTKMRETSSTPYEGGTEQIYGDIICLGGVNSRIYTDQPFTNSSINSLVFESKGISSTAFASGSANITFNHIRIVNEGVSTAADSAAADALCAASSVGLIFGNGLKIKSGYIEGLPIGCYCASDDVSYTNLKLVNCGWSTALTANDSIILFTGVNNSRVENITYTITNGNLTVNSAALRMNGTGLRNVIKDVREDANSIKTPLTAINTVATHTEVRMDNIRTDAGSITNLATGKFTFVRGVADN